MSLKIRRVVTGHDDQGRAKVLIDEQVSNVISMRPGANSSVIWSSDGFPVNNDGDARSLAQEDRHHHRQRHGVPRRQLRARRHARATTAPIRSTTRW